MAKFTKLNIGDAVASSGGRVWKKLSTESGGDISGYITFSSPSSFTLATDGATKNWDGILEYSTNANTWNEWDGATTLSADNGTLYLRGAGNTYINNQNKASLGKWKLTGDSISCSGNIETLLDYPTVLTGEHPTMAAYCYYFLFHSNANLITAPELPATTLKERCYMYMFTNCTSLTIAPELPATTLESNCYAEMFNNCTALTTAPKLPATTLAEKCYYNMFRACTSLTTIPSLPATTLANQCYRLMFYGCTNIKLSQTQTDNYQTTYRIPTSGAGTTATDALTSMFNKTGGTFTETPSIDTTYYTSNTVV